MSANKLFLNMLIFSFIFTLFACKKDEEAPSVYLDYQTITELELPFNSEWHVVWGGNTLEDNYHASLVDQRFAFDVVQIENGLSYIGNGTQNEDYYCFGDTLFAPGDGRVVEMENLIDENIPGETNTEKLFGNYIMY